MWIHAAVLGLALAGSVPPADLNTSRGEPVQLTRYVGRGKPAILFYEDKDSVALNQPLKDELFTLGRSRGLLHAATVVAVANLAGFNWFPAKNFAQKGVRDAEKKAGVPILIDWHGELSKAPWGLPDKTSTVLVLSPAGEVVFSHSGALSPERRAALFATLERLLP